MQIAELTADEVAARIDALVDLLADAIDSGASISFMRSTTRQELAGFWAGVAEQVRAGAARLLAGFDGDRLVGSVHLKLALPPNQPHRGEVTKLLVHRDARRRGLAARLMTALEAVARAEGRTLLTLDTMTGSGAEQLYRSLGWTAVGSIPDYALYPDGGLGATTIFYKRLG